MVNIFGYNEGPRIDSFRPLQCIVFLYLTRVVFHAVSMSADESRSMQGAQIGFLLATEAESAEILGGGHDEFPQNAYIKMIDG